MAASCSLQRRLPGARGASRAEVLAGVVSQAGTRLGGEAAAEVGPKQNQALPALVCVSSSVK